MKNQQLKGPIGLGGVDLTVPGVPNLGTIWQRNPNNTPDRPNDLDGVDMGNGVGKFPKKFPQGFNESYDNLQILADSFLPTLGVLGDYNYRQIFDKHVIPLHANTMSKQFTRITTMDTNPFNAALKNIATSYNPTMNEVTVEASATSVTTNAYGRYYKRNSFAEDISMVSWATEMAKAFASNAADTLNNLAGVRMWQGANKMYVKSIGAFDPTKPNAKRLTLGAKAAEVAVGLTFEAILEAKYQMQNDEVSFTNVKPGANESTVDPIETLPRRRVIPGYKSDSYLVLCGRNGYNQVMADQRFRDTFVVNGGLAAAGILDESLGKGSPILGIRFELVDNPLCLEPTAAPSRANPDYTLSTDGQGKLEVAYVVGGGVSPVGIELSLESYTKMISVDFSDSQKVDPFQLYGLAGWMSITDFTIIQNEALYAIPYLKDNSIIVAGGNIMPGDTPIWGK